MVGPFCDPPYGFREKARFFPAHANGIGLPRPFYPSYDPFPIYFCS